MKTRIRKNGPFWFVTRYYSRGILHDKFDTFVEAHAFVWGYLLSGSNGSI